MLSTLSPGGQEAAASCLVLRGEVAGWEVRRLVTRTVVLAKLAFCAADLVFVKAASLTGRNTPGRATTGFQGCFESRRPTSSECRGLGLFC